MAARDQESLNSLNMEENKEEAPIQDLFGVLGGLMTALAPAEDAAEIRKGLDELGNAMGSLLKDGIPLSAGIDETQFEAKVIRRGSVDMDNVWYKASIREARIHKETIMAQMEEWFIAELVGGQIKGSGYGGVFTREDIPERLGHFVVMRNRKENVENAETDADEEFWDDEFPEDLLGESLFEDASVEEWSSVDMNQVMFVATAEEAEIHKEEIMAQMGEYFIAELVDGKVEGEGHGGQITKCIPEHFGHLVVMKKKTDCETEDE
eukprot:GFUD01011078.1.p1 GENE.GFUD01011078.1~~GFUD01011078.1.p1  ORF type:complete len:265 (+),score=93.25 GFUD01011078.1:28-822(+)